MKISTIIFDLGGVLVDWNPEYLYLDLFNGDQTKMRWFLDNICTSEWNEMQDAGRPIKEATEILVHKYPDYENLIRLYYQDWEKMLAGPIQESVNILTKIKNLKEYKLLALTNWSAETFPFAQRKFEFLNDFEGIVVSGTEKTRKPFQKIYDTLLDRYNLKAENCVFIDDNNDNICMAQEIGIHGILYRDSASLIKDLEALQIRF